MNENKDKKASDQVQREPYLFVKNDGARIISYNIDEGERPSGVRIRVKVRVVTGKEADAADQRIGEAVKEYLKWVRQYRSTGHTDTASGTPPSP